MPDLPNVKLSQWLSLLRTLVPFAGGLLVMKGIMSATEFDSLVNQIGKVLTDVSVLAGMLAPIITATWGMIQHSDTSVVKEAAKVQGVEVKVTAAAPEAVKAIAPDLTKSP
jgi:hypothetical protein